jgi:hypothetical protein
VEYLSCCIHMPFRSALVALLRGFGRRKCGESIIDHQFQIRAEELFFCVRQAVLLPFG